MPTEDNLFSGGIAVPFSPDNRGGIAMVFGDDYISQLIRGLASNSESDNPFLDAGVAIGAIFQNVSDPAWQGQVRREIEAIFTDLQRAQIAKLLSVTMAPSETDPNEYVAQVRYLSIETNTEQQVDTTIRRA
jgi:hypothetical protein